jgi:cytochrome b subunit of formate dehydrogenase
MHLRFKTVLSLFVFVIIFLSHVQISWANNCQTCHEDTKSETDINSSVHKDLGCVDCHNDAKTIPHNKSPKQLKCTQCHDDVSKKHAFHPELANNTPEQELMMGCQDCHGTHKVKKQDGQAMTTCNDCHSDVVDAFSKSHHHKAQTVKNDITPSCLSCHNQNILKNKAAQNERCLSCHRDDENVVTATTPSKNFIVSYTKSVHGKAVAHGNDKSAGCVDCHSAHDASATQKENIAKTCSACHEKDMKAFEKSVHAISLEKGNHDSPTCTNCHGEHSITKHTNPNAPTAFANIASEVCADCHSNDKFSKKYGLSSNIFQTFKDSYHGLAVAEGSMNVAHCASCHEHHDTRSATDPESTVHQGNLIQTCGKCHPGANAQFTVGKVHVETDREDSPILFWIWIVYMFLIAGTIGGMLFHNILDHISKSRHVLHERRHDTGKKPYPKTLYLRMTVNERIQHAILAISFITLVITGFLLRYPDTWFVSMVREITGEFFLYRGLVHRIAGVSMMVISFYHVLYLLLTKRGHQLFKDLLPRWQDAKDAIGMMLYYVGISKNKPQFDRFSYIEKSEYWALIWGTVVMSMTGLILWFENYSMGYLTKIGWDIARVIHFYEAWLAALAIIVWHFYFVIFNVEVYPLNMACLKGTLTEEEMANEHPLELKKIKEKEDK